jgi:hypothetical protein
VTDDASWEAKCIVMDRNVERYSCCPLFLQKINLFRFLIRMPFLFGQGNFKKLLTKVNLLNLNSAIVYFWCYGGGVENRRRPDCLEWFLLLTRCALHHGVLAVLLLDAGEGTLSFPCRPP